eukprot:12890621-Alexandrium_andersonii.AAC.1
MAQGAVQASDACSGFTCSRVGLLDRYLNAQQPLGGPCGGQEQLPEGGGHDPIAHVTARTVLGNTVWRKMLDSAWSSSVRRSQPA